jgi:hypothetical protein
MRVRFSPLSVERVKRSDTRTSVVLRTARLTTQYPRFAAGWFARNHIATVLRSPTTALDAVDRALTIEPANTQFLIRRAQCLLALNQRRHELDAADAVERRDPTDPAIWDAVGGGAQLRKRSA